LLDLSLRQKGRKKDRRTASEGEKILAIIKGNVALHAIEEIGQGPSHYSAAQGKENLSLRSAVGRERALKEKDRACSRVGNALGDSSHGASKRFVLVG